MLKLYSVKFKQSEDAPVINGHKGQEMILDEVKDFSSATASRLQTAISHVTGIVESVYRINAANEAAAEFHETLSSLNSDNVERKLKAERRFRAYVLEFDMFLDYWESYIAHHKRIDGTSDEKLVSDYKDLFKNLTHSAYDSHMEYQLMDMIRNQTAHVQSPVNRIHVGIDGNEIYSMRDILLSKCKSGENKKKILKAQPDEIALSPIVDVTRQCLEEIHAELIDFMLDDLAMTEFAVIKDFLDYIMSKDLLFAPWILMDDATAIPNPYHISDMRAFIYVMERMEKKLSWK